MAQVTECDGCSYTSKNSSDFVVKGANQLTYCVESCSKKIDNYFDKIDELHNAVVKHWNDGMEELQGRFQDIKELPDARD